MTGQAGASQSRWLWGALVCGGLLRLLAIYLTDPSPGDGLSRLGFAYMWAKRPEWEGLTAVWMPLHWYVLGALIRVWENPLLWAYLLGWASAMGTIVFLFRAVLLTSENKIVAGISALLLALYWTHIWLTTTNFVEIYYLFFVTYAVYRLLHASQTGSATDAWMAGISTGVALFLRHEAKLIVPFLWLWVWLNGARGVAWRYAVIPALCVGWQLVEPSLRGSSFIEMVREYAKMTEMDYLTREHSYAESLRRWVLMSSSSPSAVVMLLGLYGIWLARSRWKQELPLWLFAVQTGFYLMLTISSAWQPQLRYLALGYVYLLPYAALAIYTLRPRFKGALAVVVVTMVLIQAFTWWEGRNEKRPLGWMPIFRAPAAQASLDQWVRTASENRTIYAFPGYPRGWDMMAAIVRTGRYDLIERFHFPPMPLVVSLAQGKRVQFDADVGVILIHPQVAYKETILQSLPEGAQVEWKDDSLIVVRLPSAPPRSEASHR